jgi:hypothetical protein
MLWSHEGTPQRGGPGNLQERVAAALVERYKVGRVLGQGGMGVVYLAQDLKHDRAVALKVLRPDVFAPVLTGRFLHEIKLAGSLTHPHIVPLFDSGAADGVLYYVMPYLTGETLRQRLAREGALPVEEAVRIAREVASALDYAHRQNVVHRDVKPENVLLQDGHALVCDFGVARAITVAAGEGPAARLTGGVAVGTPHYMSPEQATAADVIDGRSDIYSLGCVLYEMLTGDPPFEGDTPATVMAAHVSRPAPAVSAGRRGISRGLERALRKALAKEPAERFETAAAFASALDLAAASPAPAMAGRRWWLGAAAAAVVVAAAGLAAVPRLLNAGLDPERYVVVPFRHRGVAAPKLLDGDRCELLLYQGFRRWRDVRLSDDLAVHDALSRLGRPVTTLGDARAVARRVGAGRLVWGEVAQLGDSILVQAFLYDVRRGVRVNEHSTRLAADLGDVGARFTALADSLLLSGTRAPGAGGSGGSGTPGGGTLGTTHLAAWLAYDTAHAAIVDWDLPAAERALDRALGRDPAFAAAALWRAQVGVWRGAPADSWGPFAVRAAAGSQGVAPRDALRAEALAAQAAGRQGDACDAYRRLLASDSLDFAAWYGLGDCHARDRVVVPDPRSPSGWRFRGSYHTAARAYARAFQLNPSAHRAFFQRVPALLYLTEPTFLRTGAPQAPDTGWFAALPALAGAPGADTIAFTPYAFAEVVRAQPGRVPPTVAAAVARNRELQLGITRGWAQAFPGSAAAQEALAATLEAAGLVSRGADPAALITVQRARALATEPAQQLRLAVMETRLRLKSEDFAAARRLADSLLTTISPADAVTARQLAGLAALTGRAGRAAALLRAAAPADTPRAFTGEPVAAPDGDQAAAAALLAYAALGGPADSVRTLAARVERYVASLRPDRRPAAHSALLDQAAVLAFPEYAAIEAHRGPPSRNYVLTLQAALAAGDTAAVRAELDRIRAVRGTQLRPGDIAVTGTYHEARLLLALRDTAAAVRQLDGVLLGLATLRSDAVPDVAQSASLVRAMALRAELAARLGDRTTAGWWAGNVVTLWGGADAALAPTLAAMRAIAGN